MLSKPFEKIVGAPTMKQRKRWTTAVPASLVIGALSVGCSKSEKVQLPTPDKNAEVWELVRAFENGLQDNYLNQYVACGRNRENVNHAHGPWAIRKIGISMNTADQTTVSNAFSRSTTTPRL